MAPDGDSVGWLILRAGGLVPKVESVGTAVQIPLSGAEAFPEGSLPFTYAFRFRMQQSMRRLPGFRCAVSPPGPLRERAGKSRRSRRTGCWRLRGR